MARRRHERAAVRGLVPRARACATAADALDARGAGGRRRARASTRSQGWAARSRATRRWSTRWRRRADALGRRARQARAAASARPRRRGGAARGRGHRRRWSRAAAERATSARSRAGSATPARSRSRCSSRPGRARSAGPRRRSCRISYLMIRGRQACRSAAPPFRADHVGSLLRPTGLQEARAAQHEGRSRQRSSAPQRTGGPRRGPAPAGRRDASDHRRRAAPRLLAHGLHLSDRRRRALAGHHVSHFRNADGTIEFTPSKPAVTGKVSRSTTRSSARTTPSSPPP